MKLVKDTYYFTNADSENSDFKNYSSLQFNDFDVLVSLDDEVWNKADYQLYLLLLSMSNFDESDSGEVYVERWKINYERMSDALRGRYEGTTMSRQNVSNIFNAMKKDNIIKTVICGTTEKIYLPNREGGMKAIKLKSLFCKELANRLSSDSIKIYLYILNKCIYLDSIKVKPKRFSRNTIAEECGICNNEGKVTERSLRRVGKMLQELSELGLLKYEVATRRGEGKFESIYILKSISIKFP